MLTIKELSHQTGLTAAFIRKCLHLLADIFQNHLQFGQHNTTLINQNGVAIFREIQLLKEQNKTIPEIRAYLEQHPFPAIQTQSLLPMQREKRDQGKQEYMEEHFQEYIGKIFELQQARLDDRDKFLRELQDKDHRIQDLLRKNDALEGQIKMLPGGKSPSEVRQEYDAQVQSTRDAEQRYQELQQETEFQHREQQRNADYRQREQQRLLEDLKTTPFYQGKKRKKLMTRLGELLSPDPSMKTD